MQISRIVKDNDGESKKLWRGYFSNRELIGQLCSQVFMFSGVHLYFNNNVIKISYDLLSQEKNLRDFYEIEIFDYYMKIMQLEPNE